MKYFDFPKSVQCLVYIAQKLGSTPVNKMKALKLIWLADRLHLVKYGRPITSASYVAMKNGPVASEIRDILELNPKYEGNTKDYIQKYIITFPNQYNYSIYGECDMDEFSDTDIECLNSIIDKFGRLKEFDLSELSHAYPEWKRFEEALASEKIRAGNMEIDDFFIADESIDPIFAIDNTDLAKEIYREFDEISVLHYLTTNAKFAGKGT